MGSDFETWAMRALISMLGSGLAFFIAREIKHLNETVSALALAISDFRETVAKEYATRKQLEDAEDRFQKTVERCQDTCPLKR
jgi:hypothetical protein